MSAPASPAQWYLARDGQQFGPLSEAELAKFIDLGHLQPTDLLWRDGFPDWRPAAAVFPNRKAGEPQRVPQRRPQSSPSAPVTRPRPEQEARDPRAAQRPLRPTPMRPADRREARAAPAHRGVRKIVAAIVCLSVLGAVLWVGLAQRARFLHIVGSLSRSTPSGASATAAGGGFDVSPLVGFSRSPEAIDASLQATPLWRVLKRDYPEWYQERLKEAAGLAAQN
jgi:hypothetical protein